MARWTRTWQNKGPGAPSGDLIRNTSDGWVIEDPRLHWQGADDLGGLLMVGGGGRSVLRGDVWGEAGALAHSGGHSFPAITRATSIIVDTLAGVDWRVRRGRETLPSPRWLSDPGLSRPDLRISDYSPGIQPMDTMAWRATLLVSCLWHGDGFVWVPSRDAQGQPVAPLFVLNPQDVEVQEYDTDVRQRGYWISVGGGQSVRLGPEEIIHVRGMAPIVDGRGQGVLASHLESWREAVAQREYAQGLYSAGIPAGYLKTSAPNLTEPQAEALKAKWMENHGSTRRSIAVLNAVTEFHPIQMPPEAAQMVEAKRLSILDVANAFGVEPYMLGLPSDGSTYANIQDRMVSFARFTLLPWARRVEEALSREFATGTSVHLDLDSLARANSADRSAYYAQGLAEGWLTIDEVREAEGLPPLATGRLATVVPVVSQESEDEEIPA